MLIDNIKKLSDLCGTSGDEGDVRNYIKELIKDYADEIIIDSIGNLIAIKKGDSSKRIMISAHMDEVGFIISGINDKGYLEFKTVGGIDTRVILSKKVIIGKNKVRGVIGMKAIHLQKRAERDSVPEVSDLYIDIGAKDKEEAQKLVSEGDYACFDTKCEYYGEDVIKGKALDDRIGCGILVELMKKPIVYDTYFCFTAQEEVGLRGARCCAYRIEPDVALVIESTTANDVYGAKEHEFVTKLGGGACITFMDRTTIVNNNLRNALSDLAQANNIPFQFKQAVAGGNDAGRIHLTKGGIATASLSVATRYLHSPCALASCRDIDAVYELASAFLDKIDEVI